jgi:hypothetical protein
MQLKNAKKINVIWLVLTILPIIYLIKILFYYSVNMPFQDDWYAIIPMVDKAFSGHLSFQDLWAPYNEHRIILFKLVALCLIYFGKWQTIHFALLNFFLMTIPFGLMTFWLVRKVNKRFSNDSILWAVPVISFMLFSLMYDINWVWTIETGIFMCLAGAIAGLFLLCTTSLNTKKYILSVICGIIATFSFGSGLFYWPIGLIVLLVRSFSKEKWNYLPTALWIGISGLVWFSYLWNFSTDSSNLGIYFVFVKPLIFANHFLTTLGYPLSLAHISYTNIIGLTGLIWFLGLGTYLLKKKIVDFDLVSPFFAIGLYSILVIFFISIGRAELGMDFTIKPRYLFFSVLLWISNIVFTFIFLSYLEEKTGSTSKKSASVTTLKIFKFFFLSFILIFYILRGILGTGQVLYYLDMQLLIAQHEILVNHQYPDKALLNIPEYSILKYISTLKKYNLSFYNKNQLDKLDKLR